MMTTTTPTLYPDTIVETKEWYENNIKDTIGFRDITRHIDMKATKKKLGKITGKLSVFVMTVDNPDYDERANTNIVYKYPVACNFSHPLGKQNEWGFCAECPQGVAIVIKK